MDQKSIAAAGLSVEQQELLAYLLMEEGVELPQQQTVSRREHSDNTPLSFAQQRLWFLDQLETGNSIYNVPLPIHLRGNLDIVALEKTLSEVVRRHEVLRTTFALVEGAPVQIIAPAQALSLPITDLQTLSPEEGKQTAERLVEEEAQLPFDLSTGPLLRAKLLRLSEQEHVILFTLHHIVSDGWSLGVLVKEVASLYEAFSRGDESPLEELAIQYADYSIWQRGWLSGEVLEKQLSYWREQLTGAPPVLELPTDRPRPAVQSYRGAHALVEIDKEIVEGLKGISRQEGATLFMVLVAAFQTLLYRMSGQSDISTGTPIAGRTRAETENLIGFFVNTVVLRTKIEGGESFRGLVGRVKEVTLGAYGHQDVPFEMLVEELKVERDLSRTPLFQTVMVLQNAPQVEFKLGDLQLSPIATQGTTAKFDLTMELQENASGLNGFIQYNTDLFDEATIGRLLRHFNKLLKGIVANPDQTIERLPLLSQGELDALLREWNDKPLQAESPRLCIHEQFEKQAEQTPSAVALSFEQQHLSYKELNQKANQLAHYLRRLGIGPEQRVAILMERSVEMVISLLAVLKAGAAYVPLEPQYPQERLSFMLGDSGVEVLLTQEAVRTSLGEELRQEIASRGMRVVSVDEEWEQIASESIENIESGVSAGNLAYVIYTSGSTGRPKGVLVPHANVSALLDRTRQHFNFNEHDVWTLFHSYAFDFSVWELWGALLHGCRLVIVPYLVSRSPEEFYELLRKEQVTVLNQTPSAFRQLSQFEESLKSEDRLSLRLVIFGGEALETQSLRPWFERHGDARPQLVNMYGITETTVHVTYRPLSVADLNKSPASVIGKPIAGWEFYLLDRHLQPVPVGVTGEIYVGGEGVARGYGGQPVLTAQRFVPDPFSGREGARLYRTGDLGRFTGSGEIEYVGRADEQVKIRGFRIELGEIEAVLKSHAAIREALVLARADQRGEKHLVAYIVGVEKSELTTSELRRHLKEQLPEYMVPQAFVLMERMPLTSNGKVDRKALPAPDQLRLELSETFVAPSTPGEQILAEVWSEVLEIERVGVNDNFFAMGGDSIRSIRVMALAKERGLVFSLQQLFQHQTVAELAGAATVLESSMDTAVRHQPFSLLTESDRLKLPEGIEDAYPLTMLQAGMLYHMELTPDVPMYHNVDSMLLQGMFELESFKKAVAHVVARHPVLRTSFDLSTYSEPLQLVHRTAEFSVGSEDLRHLADEEREAVIDEFISRERKSRFDLGQPPLLRFYIHQQTDNRFQFTLTECHAILDGWSLHSTLSEIFSNYFAILNHGAPLEEPLITSAFRDFVRLEREALASEECRDYWKRQLSDCSIIKLPRLKDSEQGTEGPRIGQLSIAIPREVSAGLKELAALAKVSLKSILLAAHVKVMSLVGGQQDVLTGLTTNGRLEEMDGERVRGLFLNLVPFRLRPRGRSWVELVQETFEAERELLPYRRYPLSALQREWGEQPLFEAAFNYVHFHVVDALIESGEIGVLGFKKAEKTNFTLQAHFHSMPVTADVRLELEYEPAVLTEEQAQHIAGYYVAALKAMADDPFAGHDSRCLLSPSEQQQILSEWNDTEMNYPQGKVLHEQFEKQAEQTPSAIALSFEQQHLSYKELNQKANQLAHYLRRLGIGPEQRVAILMERSVEMVISLLAVLKAGGAYVPLEPQYPQERLSFMVEDAGVEVLLTQEGVRARLADELAAKIAGTGMRVVSVDEEWEQIASESIENIESGVRAGNLAYVIYTSGSTGRPKGAMNTHGAVCNRLFWMQDAYRLNASDSVLQKTAFSFDVSVWEFFWPLLVGARLVMARPGAQHDTASLVEVITRDQVTTMHFVPSMLRAFLEDRDVSRCQSLRRVISSGEALSPDLVPRFYERLPEARFYNLYGPTEAAIDVTAWPCPNRSEQPGELQRVPIGKPIANTQIYVLDAGLLPVPVGAAGELYIAGVGVGRGYLKRADLTAEKFVPDPYARLAGARMYRSGDRARYLPDGNIEYLGRTDAQVKVRGYRIELGEIESVLAQHESVSEAVVVILDDAGADNRLVAYVVGASETESPSITELRRHLKEQLPEYMVPQAFVLMERIPLTPNGKADRRALPAPQAVRPEVETPYVPPQSELERAIANIWQEALRLERVGVHDNFFDLGGHSLVMLQVHGKLRELYGVEFSMVEMFEYPTISLLAGYLSRAQQAPTLIEQSQQRAETRKSSTRRQRLRRMQDRSQVSVEESMEEIAG
jgi:amino acid adenylation domain-containing protein